MNLTTLSLEDFLCEDPAHNAPAAPTAFLCAKPLLASLIGEKVRDVGEYTLHKLNTGVPGDVVLLWQGEPVGCYFGELLVIDDDDKHRGHDLSVPLILEAVKHRPNPTSRKMSEAGKAALTKAWRVANGEIPGPWP